MRDARPFLQIAHIGRWHYVEPETLEDERSRSYRGGASALRALPRHDPTAVLALRQWLEAIALRDPVGRKLPTWLVETGARTGLGDERSFAAARAAARAIAHGVCAARLCVAGREDALGPRAPNEERTLDARFGARHPSPPLTLRAPHGAFEVQLLLQDTERDRDEPARARTRSLRDEHAPAEGAPVLLLTAGYDHAVTARRTGDDRAWVLSSDGAPESVEHTTSGSFAARSSQSVALVRVYASPSQRRAAIVERLWFTRPLAIGGFSLVPSRTIERSFVWPQEGDAP